MQGRTNPNTGYVFSFDEYYYDIIRVDLWNEMSENAFGKAGCVMAAAGILISAYQMGKMNGETSRVHFSARHSFDLRRKKSNGKFETVNSVQSELKESFKQMSSLLNNTNDLLNRIFMMEMPLSRRAPMEENQTVQPSTSKCEQPDNDQNADKNEKTEAILRQRKTFSRSVVEKAAAIASGGNQEVKELAGETVSVLERMFDSGSMAKSIETDGLMDDDHKTIGESVVEDNTGCKCFICLQLKVDDFRVIKVVVRSGGCAEMILLSGIVKNYLENRMTATLEQFNAFNVISNSEYKKVSFGEHVKVLWQRAISEALKDLKCKQQNIVE